MVISYLDVNINLGNLLGAERLSSPYKAVKLIISKYNYYAIIDYIIVNSWQYLQY